MNIIVNLIPLREGAIVRESYIFRNLSKIDKINQYVILGRSEMEDIFSGLGDNFRFQEVNLDTKNYLKRFFWENFKLPFLVKKLKGDILYFPHQLTNLFDFTKKVIEIRNALPFEKQITKELTFFKKLKFKLLALATRISIQRADCTIFISEHLKRKVLRGEISGCFPVIRHGLSLAEVSQDHSREERKEVLKKYEVKEDYILSISHIHPYKNIINLLRGYKVARERCPNLEKLVIVGRIYDKEYFSLIQKYLEEHQLEDFVKLIGGVQHKDLINFYQSCHFFIFPSKCENAPITLIEALNFGTPIASSNIEANVEICNDSAMYFDPDNPEEIAKSLITMHGSEDLRKNLSKKSRERAKDFSWEKSARQILEVFNKINS